MPSNLQIQLARRPDGAPVPADFRAVVQPVPELADGEVLVQHRLLSLDPYMRGRMSAAQSYAEPLPLDAVMPAATVGEVVASRSATLAVGTHVVGQGGWQQYQHVAADAIDQLRPVNTARLPSSTYLGALGMPGVTAWYGVQRLLAVQPGQSVVISSAAGTVGGLAGQLVRHLGARAVGIAGGADKCHHVQQVLGFDACIDYRAFGGDSQALQRALAAEAPDGFDAAFENVGGWILDAVLPSLRHGAAVAVCGLIAGYDGAPVPLRDPLQILKRRLRIEGFIIGDQAAVWSRAVRELAVMTASGALRCPEHVVTGLSEAPQAFCDMLQGRWVGKTLVAP